MKKCRVCKNEFQPYQTTQVVCSVRCAVINADKAKVKEWNKRKKVMKDELMTVQDLMKIAQQVFNKYIRLRDSGKNCISCGKIMRDGNIDAGHLWSAGGHSNVRFNEFNVNAQCSRPCNKDKAGDINNYRIGFIKRYGIEELEKLDSIAKLEKKFSKQDLKDIINLYRKKCNYLNK